MFEITAMNTMEFLRQHLGANVVTNLFDSINVMLQNQKEEIVTEQEHEHERMRLSMQNQN